MAAYVEETARSFPNPISSREFTKPFKRPSSSRYRSHSSAPELGTGTEYFITFEGAGPGSIPMGKDSVHYIGDNDPTAVGAWGNRSPVYRYYRSNKRDHKYSIGTELSQRDMGAENEDWKSAAGGYAKEPRNGRPVFFILNENLPGTAPLRLWYSYWPDNTVFTLNNDTPGSTGNGKGQYKDLGIIGYVYTSNPGISGVTPLYHYQHGSRSASSGVDIDDFYTIDPASEVDLRGGPIAPKKRLKERYDYQGILGYVFDPAALDAAKIQVRDIGKIGPTGQCIDKTGWYQFEADGSNYSLGNYFRGFDPFCRSYNGWGRGDRGIAGKPPSCSGGTPGVVGFGNPDNVEIIDPDANFEWLYGLNGAIKGAVPRFLGFEDSYDSQFYYYLYDTTYPWNGPIFGIQYALNDAACCPNTTAPKETTTAVGPDGSTTSTINVPTCDPATHYYSHFYQIKSDSWETTRTRITINDISTFGVREGFNIVDTDSRTLLFRYTGGNTSGSFKRGDKINGWDISNVLYYGDELRAGTIELTAQQSGNAFNYLDTYTSPDGAEITVLAGYGIKNKAAFAGTYEFPKRIAYWKVSINPKALIPSRTLDKAEAVAVVGNNGEITEVIMVAGGRGYKKPFAEAINPRVLEDFGAGDLTKFMKDGVVASEDEVLGQSFNTPDASFTIDDNIFETFDSYGVEIGQVPYALDKNQEKIRLKKAVLSISDIDDLGSIQSIRVVDGGSGYDQSEPPTIFIAEPETFDYESPPIAEGSKQESEKTIEEMGTSFASKFQSALPAADYERLNGFMQGSFVTATTGPAVSVVDTYLRAPDISDDVTKFCFDLPANCIDIPSEGQLGQVPENWDGLFQYTSVNPGVAAFQKDGASLVEDGFKRADAYLDDMNGLYGAFGGDRCITMGQPNIYNVRRWFDMPCAYLASDDEGDQKAFGYLPYKYCASEEKEAMFRVSLEVEGRVTGSMGSDFMNYFSSFQKPKLTMSRKPEGGYRTWSCRRGAINGRCYRDPSDENDIVFVPVGLDENTFDYNRSGFSEYQQFRLWLGDNLTGGGLTSNNPVSWQWGETTTTTTSTTDPATGETTTSSSSSTTNYNDGNQYTAFTFDCSPDPGDTNAPNHNCWDKYVRGTGSPSDAPLDVYCGYDTNGNGMPGERFWEITGPAFGDTEGGHTTPSGPVNPFCSLCNSFAGGYLGFPFVFLLGGTGGPPACGLEQVNDASIAVDPQRTYDYGDGNGKVMHLGSYDGTMMVRNWLTGGVIALARTIRNMGNPYFDECSGATFWDDGNELNDDI